MILLKNSRLRSLNQSKIIQGNLRKKIIRIRTSSINPLKQLIVMRNLNKTKVIKHIQNLQKVKLRWSKKMVVIVLKMKNYKLKHFQRQGNKSVKKQKIRYLLTGKGVIACNSANCKLSLTRPKRK